MLIFNYFPATNSITLGSEMIACRGNGEARSKPCSEVQRLKAT